MTVSEILTQKLRESDKSTRQIAREAGLGVAIVHRIRAGQRELGHKSTIDKLAEYFGLELKPKRKKRWRQARST